MLASNFAAPIALFQKLINAFGQLSFGLRDLNIALKKAIFFQSYIKILYHPQDFCVLTEICK